MKLKFFYFLFTIAVLNSCTEINSSESSRNKETISVSETTNNEPLYTIINDDIYYNLMNETVFQGDSSSPDDWIKIETKVRPHIGNWLNHINSLDSILTKEDIIFMCSQIDTLNMTWDCNKLKFVNCLDSRVVDSIFSIEKEYNESTNENTDAWQIFRNKFGNGGIHRYSKPIFNLDTTIILIEHAGQGGWTLGSGEIYIFKKKDKIWNYLGDIDLWIS